jgi:hypothetical protein
MPINDPWPDRATVIAQATDELRRRLHPSKCDSRVTCRPICVAASHMAGSSPTGRDATTSHRMRHGCSSLPGRRRSHRSAAAGTSGRLSAGGQSGIFGGAGDRVKIDDTDELSDRVHSIPQWPPYVH